MNTFSDKFEEASAIGSAPRGVLRAVSELRRGAPVLIITPPGEGRSTPLVLLAAETMSATAVGDAAAVAGPGPRATMLMSDERAALLRGSGVAPRGASSRTLSAFAAPDLATLASAAAGAPSADWTRAPPGPPVDVPTDGAAALALLKLARLLPMALVVPCVEADGALARAAGADVLTVDPADVTAYAMRSALALSIVAEAPVPLADAADARLVAFRAPDAGIEHVAVVVGDPAARAAPLVRIHSECFTGDLIGSLRCDCGDQLRGAIRRIAAEGAGVILYLAQEGRGIGLVNKLRAYVLQDAGLDTLDANLALGWAADERSFLLAATMLQRLGLPRVRLLTNNPDKIASLSAFGVEVIAREPIAIAPNEVNESYLRTKRLRFGHLGIGR